MYKVLFLLITVVAAGSVYGQAGRVKATPTPTPFPTPEYYPPRRDRIAGAPMPQSIGYLPLSLGGLLMVVFALYRLFLVLHAPPTDEAR